MPNTYTYQTVIDNNSTAVVKLTAVFDGSSDESNPYRVASNSFFNALNTDNDRLVYGGVAKSFYETSINKIWYSANTSGSVELFWNGTATANISFINNNGHYNKMGNWVSINNNAVNPTGDIGIKASNMQANNYYTVILELRKNPRDYDTGWFVEPGVFNYNTNYIIDENNNDVFIVTENELKLEV